MTEVLIKRLSKNIELPKYETNGSSGMDLSANIEKQIKIEPGKTSIVPTGISVSIPKNFEIQIRSRSGLAAKRQVSVLNSPGTIDADFRGELKNKNDAFNGFVKYFNGNKFNKHDLLVIYKNIIFDCRPDRLSGIKFWKKNKSIYELFHYH